MSKYVNLRRISDSIVNLCKFFQKKKKNLWCASPIFLGHQVAKFRPPKKTLSNKGIRGKAKRMGNFFITCSYALILCLLYSPDVFLWGWEEVFFVLVLAGSWNFRGTVGSGFIPLFHLNMLHGTQLRFEMVQGKVQLNTQSPFSLENLEFLLS
jgi:hypothetical protein